MATTPSSSTFKDHLRSSFKQPQIWCTCGPLFFSTTQSMLGLNMKKACEAAKHGSALKEHLGSRMVFIWKWDNHIWWNTGRGKLSMGQQELLNQNQTACLSRAQTHTHMCLIVNGGHCPVHGGWNAGWYEWWQIIDWRYIAQMMKVASVEKHSFLMATAVSKRWKIGLC